MNISSLRKNENNILVDEVGNKVFQNQVFDQLMAYEHMSMTTPASQYVDAQANQVFFQNPEDTRRYIDINCSRLLDDNASLANKDVNVVNTYLSDVISFLAVVNKIVDNQDVNNKILGDTFTTKNNDSLDSKIPMYLCVEILRAKCLAFLGKQMDSLENFNVANNGGNSTLGMEFDKVVNKTKNLNYDKEYFGQDINEVTEKWLSACQIDATGSVDLYAKCEEKQCLIFMTQKVMENGQETLNKKSSPMFEVKKTIVSVPSNPVAPVTNTLSSTPDVFAGFPANNVFENVTVVDNNNKVEAMNNTNKVITLSEQSTKMAGYRAELKKLTQELKNKEKEKDEIQAQIDSVLEKIFNEDSYNNENSQIKGMVA